jgi:hypothetical protein
MPADLLIATFAKALGMISPLRPSLALFRTSPTATSERDERAPRAVAPRPAVAVGRARDAAAGALLYITCLSMQY